MSLTGRHSHNNSEKVPQPPLLDLLLSKPLHTLPLASNADGVHRHCTICWRTASCCTAVRYHSAGKAQERIVEKLRWFSQTQFSFNLHLGGYFVSTLSLLETFSFHRSLSPSNLLSSLCLHTGQRLFHQILSYCKIFISATVKRTIELYCTQCCIPVYRNEM